jgi:hypothetical protein
MRKPESRISTAHVANLVTALYFAMPIFEVARTGQMIVRKCFAGGWLFSTIN